MSRLNLTRRNLGATATVLSLAFALGGCSSLSGPAASNAGAPVAKPAALASTPARIIMVEWRIKKGREQEFLDYWSTKATVGDRTGLIGEFLSGVEDRVKYPWMVWPQADSGDYTIFYNVGLWRDAGDFYEQVGKFIDNSRPPLDFEAEKRRRVLVAPQRWRIGESKLPAADAAGVK